MSQLKFMNVVFTVLLGLTFAKVLNDYVDFYSNPFMQTAGYANQISAEAMTLGWLTAFVVVFNIVVSKVRGEK